MRVAVVGGTGTVGALAVQELVRRGHEPRVLSRRAPIESGIAEHRRVDLATGEGLREAPSGIEAVIDASNVTKPGKRAREVPVAGTERMLRAEAAAGVI